MILGKMFWSINGDSSSFTVFSVSLDLSDYIKVAINKIWIKNSMLYVEIKLLGCKFLWNFNLKNNSGHFMVNVIVFFSWKIIYNSSLNVFEQNLFLLFFLCFFDLNGIVKRTIIIISFKNLMFYAEIKLLVYKSLWNFNFKIILGILGQILFFVSWRLKQITHWARADICDK